MSKNTLWWILGISAGLGVVAYLVTQSNATPTAAPGSQRAGSLPPNTAGQTVTQAGSGQIASTQYVGSTPTEDGFEYDSSPPSSTAVGAGISQDVTSEVFSTAGAGAGAATS